MNQTPRILLHNTETASLATTLRAAHPGVEIAECATYESLPNALSTFRPEVVYTVRFAGTPGYPRGALFNDDGPKWVANGGVGIDHFGHWEPTKTTVTNAAGVAADAMAEYIMGVFLHFAMDVPGLTSDKSARLWQARSVTPLKGKTLLIVGLGHTGQALALRAKAFGMRVIGTRRTPRPMDNVDRSEAADKLHTLLPDADTIAITTPLTNETRGLIDATAFALMKPGVLFADVSRGGVVDQTSLADMLATKHIKGAGVDVFETEPLPIDNPLWGLDNLILSPHCSSVFDGWETASFQLFLDNLALWVAGKPLFNIVDPNRGY